jgi:phage terminase Nu1 subunit (DNA packaging protein)
MQVASPDDRSDGMLVSVSEAARIKGVTKQTISEKLQRLGIATAKRGREKVFRLAEYDAAANETTDPARLIAQQTTKTIRGDEPTGAGGEKDPGYTQQLTRKAGFEADLKEIEIQKQRGELLPIAEVSEAMARCAEAIVRDVDQLPTFAEDLAGALARGGVDALRVELKKRARQIRETLARSMTLLATPDDEEAEGAVS